MSIHEYEPIKTRTSIEETLTTLRAGLASLATTEGAVREITATASLIAEHEGALEVVASFERVAERLGESRTEGDDGEYAFALLSHVTSALVSGAEDTSSGRGNDARRSRFDGRLAAVREIQFYLDLQLKSSSASKSANA